MSKPDLGTLSLIVAGEHVTERLRKAIVEECCYKGVARPTDAQIAAVLRGLADHTMMMAASHYDKRELYPYQDRKTEFWPTETSIARFIRDAGHAFEDAQQTNNGKGE